MSGRGAKRYKDSQLVHRPRDQNLTRSSFGVASGAGLGLYLAAVVRGRERALGTVVFCAQLVKAVDLASLDLTNMHSFEAWKSLNRG